LLAAGNSRHDALEQRQQALGQLVICHGTPRGLQEAQAGHQRVGMGVDLVDRQNPVLVATAAAQEDGF
jgi:hypothetical protein